MDNIIAMIFVIAFAFVGGGLVGETIQQGTQYDRCLDRNSTMVYSAAIQKCNMEIKGKS